MEPRLYVTNFILLRQCFDVVGWLTGLESAACENTHADYTPQVFFFLNKWRENSRDRPNDRGLLEKLPLWRCRFITFRNVFNLYRETNLKVRQALVETAEMNDDVEQLSAFDGRRRLLVHLMTSYVLYTITGQLADWTTRGLEMPPKERKLSTQSPVVSASCPVRDLSSTRIV